MTDKCDQCGVKLAYAEPCGDPEAPYKRPTNAHTPVRCLERQLEQAKARMAEMEDKAYKRDILIEEFQESSMLLNSSGDTDGIIPADIEKHINTLQTENKRLRGKLVQGRIQCDKLLESIGDLGPGFKSQVELIRAEAALEERE